MSIRDVLAKKIDNVKVNQTKSLLKPGQIVQGKIVKLYPNNKAQIQLGSQTMIAQLEASLTIGENYHFQVKSNGDVTHLKVVGERLKRSVNDNMQMLLQGLGMKATKANIALMEQVMKDKIPFDRDELMQAFHILGGAQNKEQAQSVIKEMLGHKLPLTDSIFQALYTKSTNGFGDQLNSLLQQLRGDTNQTPLKTALIERISPLTEHSISNKEIISKQILAEIESNQTNLLVIAKSTGLVNEKVDFSTWKTGWQNFVKSKPDAPLPFQLNTSELLHALEQTVNDKGRILKQSQTIEQQFSSMINKATIHQVPLSVNNFTELKAVIETKLLPLMSDKQQQQVRKLLQNNSTSLEQLQTLLKTFSNEQTYAQIESLMKGVSFGENELGSKPGADFMAQVKQVLQSIGLADEHYLANNLLEKQSGTIKSMLTQLLQQSDGITNDRAQQLLHFVNGMQIQSVNDTVNFLQASIQIPGEKLTLNGDLQLEFEGKKTESGKIDPAYCRILFYLNLTNLKETVIDMNIQKRAVSVTVFNDNNTISDHSLALKPMLRDGLSALGYHLSTITVKPLKQTTMAKNNISKRTENNSYQGVDYRV